MSNSAEQISSLPESDEALSANQRQAIGTEAVRIWSNPGMEVLNSPQQRFVKVDLEQSVAMMHFSIRGSSVPADLEGKELYITSDGSLINASVEPYNLSVWPKQDVAVQILSRGFSPSVRPRGETEGWQKLGQPITDEDLPALLEALKQIEPFDRGLIE